MAEILEETLGPGWDFRRTRPGGHVLASFPEGLFWAARRADGTEWRLFNQMPFGHSASGPGTISVFRRPDYVLAEFRDGAPSRWMLLDAKYWTAQSSIQEALQSMHAYRDSLLWRHEGKTTAATCSSRASPTRA